MHEYNAGGGSKHRGSENLPRMRKGGCGRSDADAVAAHWVVAPIQQDDPELFRQRELVERSPHVLDDLGRGGEGLYWSLFEEGVVYGCFVATHV